MAVIRITPSQIREINLEPAPIGSLPYLRAPIVVGDDDKNAQNVPAGATSWLRPDSVLKILVTDNGRNGGNTLTIFADKPVAVLEETEDTDDILKIGATSYSGEASEATPHVPDPQDAFAAVCGVAPIPAGIVTTTNGGYVYVAVPFGGTKVFLQTSYVEPYVEPEE